MQIVDIIVFLAGLGLVGWTLMSAIRNFVLPRSAPDHLARIVFILMRHLFELRLRFTSTYRERDRIMAYYAPVSLLLLVPFWLTLVLMGYMGMFWALHPQDAPFMLSGSSLLTLGFAYEDGIILTLLTYSEATIGLILVALLIAYLPTMYSAFAIREHLVSRLEVYTGVPPSAIEMIKRLRRIGQMNNLDFWERWEQWFAQVAESHTTLPALVFFRSPHAEISWVNAAGAVLDAGALFLSVLDVPREPKIALCLRAGYLCLRRISDFFQIPYDPHATFPAEPISISRAEFDQACATLAAAGVPIKADRDQAWQDFAGWRVNYDKVLLLLCSMTMAPESLWSADRAPKFVVPSLWMAIKRGER